MASDELLARLEKRVARYEDCLSDSFRKTGTDLKDAASRIHAQAARIAELEAKLAAMTTWLENNQPDVWRRGMWEALRAAEKEG